MGHEAGAAQGPHIDIALLAPGYPELAWILARFPDSLAGGQVEDDRIRLRHARTLARELACIRASEPGRIGIGVEEGVVEQDQRPAHRAASVRFRPGGRRTETAATAPGSAVPARPAG